MNIESPSNVEFIYQYTEKAFQSVNKSNDIATTKLSQVLAFSGILLKFAYDVETDNLTYIPKILLLILLISSVLFSCFGLMARSPGDIEIEPDYLLEQQYGMKHEEMLVMICRARNNKGIPALKKLRNYRVRWLNLAICCLLTSGLIFGFTGITSVVNFLAP